MELLALRVRSWELVLSAASFGHIIGISDGGKHVEVNSDVCEIGGYLDRLEASSKGIHIKKLADIVRNYECDDGEFKVMFTLFVPCSVLCPLGGVHISSSLLVSLKDVKRISLRNRASFCFHKLMRV